MYIGHEEVENRLKEIWEHHLDNLWQEVLETMEHDVPLERQKLQEQPSTSAIQQGGGQTKMSGMKNHITFGKKTREQLRKAQPQKLLSN